MARLADRIWSMPWRQPAWVQVQNKEIRDAWIAEVEQFKSKVVESEVILCDNVSEFLYAESPKEIWNFERDFPCCAPPFPRFFIESLRPSRLFSEELGVRHNSEMPQAWGVFFDAVSQEEIAKQVQNGEGLVNMENGIKQQIRMLEATIDLLALQKRLMGAADPRKEFERLSGTEKTYIQTIWALEQLRKNPSVVDQVAENVCWAIHGIIIVQIDNMICGPLGHFNITIGKHGSVLAQPQFLFLGGHLPEARPYLEVAGQTMASLLYAPMLTLSFLNCKNVVMTRTDEPGEARTRRNRAKHELRPLVRYHTLNIEPMKTVLRREGQSESVGLPKALHICRGHFATYTEDRPLFGKVTGTFWKSAHLRGKAKHGIVSKQYSVNAPSGGA